MPEKLAEIPSLWEAFKADKHILFEITLVGKNGDKIPVEINAHMGLFEGRPSVLTIVRDISQRQRREEEIRRLASFPQLDPHPVLEVDTAGKVIYANVAAQKTIERVGGGGVEEFLPADLGDMIKSAQETGVNLVYREKAVKDTIFEESINFTPGYNVMRLYIMDITEKQRAEKALRDSEGELRLLTSRLLNVQENERRRISAELHDELGQALMLFKLKLHALKDRLRKDQKSLREECGHSLQYLDGIIENVRRLSRDLSPTVLEELGLSSAIRLCLEEFSKHYEVQDLSVDLDEVDDLFPPRVQLNIYRIFQECLTNIGRHARAAKISLAVKKERDRVVFRIQDDGQGFDVNQARARESSARGIGLATMAERVRMIGGSLEIRSHTGSGTEIIFAVPLVTRREAEDGPIPDNIS